MKEATWPTFIAAPFIWPKTSKICSAASTWRFSAAARRASSPRVRFAAFVAYWRAVWPPASRPTLAARRTRPVGIFGSSVAIASKGTDAGAADDAVRPAAWMPARVVSRCEVRAI